MTHRTARGLERVRQQKYDLLLVDVEMPNMRGDELLRRLARSRRSRT